MAKVDCDATVPILFQISMSKIGRQSQSFVSRKRRHITQTWSQCVVDAFLQKQQRKKWGLVVLQIPHVLYRKKITEDTFFSLEFDQNKVVADGKYLVGYICIALFQLRCC